ncbi:MAG TPA: SxtJ family membrane protein [Methylomirabilota bacterium]|nr:SxtJ family membrane protein [Methylomirabilota bacterium]
MIARDLKELKTGKRELRNFGLLVGGIFAALGAWFLYRGKVVGPWFLGVGAPLMLLGLIAPQALRRVYLAWMAMALVMGFVVSTVLLTLFYFVVITPIGLIARLAGKDFMTRRLDKSAPSYWTERSTAAVPATRYEEQF